MAAILPLHNFDSSQLPRIGLHMLSPIRGVAGCFHEVVCRILNLPLSSSAEHFIPASNADLLYPSRVGMPENAEGPWEEMTNGSADQSQGDGTIAEWFDTFSKEDLDDIYVGEDDIAEEEDEEGEDD